MRACDRQLHLSSSHPSISRTSGRRSRRAYRSVWRPTVCRSCRRAWGPMLLGRRASSRLVWLPDGGPQQPDQTGRQTEIFDGRGVELRVMPSGLPNLSYTRRTTVRATTPAPRAACTLTHLSAAERLYRLCRRQRARLRTSGWSVSWCCRPAAQQRARDVPAVADEQNSREVALGVRFRHDSDLRRHTGYRVDRSGVPFAITRALGHEAPAEPAARSRYANVRTRPRRVKDVDQIDVDPALPRYRVPAVPRGVLLGLSWRGALLGLT